MLRFAHSASAIVLAWSGVAAAEPYILLEPVAAVGGPTRLAGPEGHLLPVLKRAETRPLVAEVSRVLSAGFAARIPALDTAARDAAFHKPHCPGLPKAVYVLLSVDDGGFARQGFFLRAPDGALSRCDDYFVDITADGGSIASGEFEEVLAHEWGHVLLRRLWGPVPPTPSRKFHSVRVVTDPVTAFDEGFGAHLQPLSARLTTNPSYRGRIEGTLGFRLADQWFSRQETWARQALVSQNRFVFDKRSYLSGSDLYRRWLDDEASVDLNPCRLKLGAQMVASEGVVAAFFHGLMAVEPGHLDQRYRQLIAIGARLRNWPARETPIVAFVRAWGEEFPQERWAVIKLFLEVTHGATASEKVRALSEKAACAGASGDIEGFIAARQSAETARTALLAEILAGKISLDGAIGPQLWVANPKKRIAAAPWMSKRDLPVVVDLNTAGEPELALAFDGTGLSGSAAKIVAARRTGSFRELSELVKRAGLSPSEAGDLTKAHLAFTQVGSAVRK